MSQETQQLTFDDLIGQPEPTVVVPVLPKLNPVEMDFLLPLLELLSAHIVGGILEIQKYSYKKKNKDLDFKVSTEVVDILRAANDALVAKIRYIDANYQGEELPND